MTATQRTGIDRGENVGLGSPGPGRPRSGNCCRVVSDPGAGLSKGLEPPTGGWRASVRRPGALPQYPLVLHRGGFPDGS
jgi:hypothetical protein